ncbi:MAG: gliding motility-associated C-terminal domain-containing protein [Bacteroidales bacterium]|nr:gliding motility-associated C-terminal domain-containing protein [Bacteroidales bacterium]
MNSVLKYLLPSIFFINVLLPALYSQVPGGPEPPDLKRVTVDPETGYAILHWTHSPSSNVAFYAIEIIIIQGLEGPTGITIDQVPATDTFYVYEAAKSNFQSDGYSVYSIGNDGKNGTSTQVDSTIYTTAIFDSCSASIQLKWNDYNSWRGEIARYRIYSQINNSPPVIEAIVSEGTNVYSFQNFQVNSDYGFFIEAEHNDGRKSRSNKAEVNTNMAKNPDYINADFATKSNDNTVNLSFTIDPGNELKDFVLLRSVNPNGPWDTISYIYLMGNNISYNDLVNFNKGPYYYRLGALNYCNQVAASSNIAGTILLSGSSEGLSNELSWNPYVDWNGDLKEYQVYRRFGDNFFQQIHTTLATQYLDTEIENLQFTNLPDHVCYEIKALEAGNNPYGITGSSTSNEICFTLKAQVQIPNAFTPNGDGINDTFGPMFSYIPSNYIFQIFNRWGIKVFETRDPFEKWDGLVSGKPGPESVYIYIIESQNAGKRNFRYNGHVTVVYP